MNNFTKKYLFLTVFVLISGTALSKQSMQEFVNKNESIIDTVFNNVVFNNSVELDTSLQGDCDVDYNLLDKQHNFAKLKLELDTYLQNGGDINEFFLLTGNLQVNWDISQKKSSDCSFVNYTSEMNYTLLMCAANNQSFELVQYLLDNGANPLLRNNKGVSIFCLMSSNIKSLVYSFLMGNADDAVKNLAKIFELLLNSVDNTERKIIFQDWVSALKYVNNLYDFCNTNESDSNELDEKYKNYSDEQFEASYELNPADIPYFKVVNLLHNAEYVNDLIVRLEKYRTSYNKNFIKAIEHVLCPSFLPKNSSLMDLPKDEFIAIFKKFHNQANLVLFLYFFIIGDLTNMIGDISNHQDADKNYPPYSFYDLALQGDINYIFVYVSEIVSVIPYLLDKQPESCLKIFNYFIEALDESDKKIVSSKLIDFLQKMKKENDTTDSDKIIGTIDFMLEKLA